MQRTHFKAFSLIELVVVIAIIGIVSAIAVPIYKSYREKASAAALYPYIDSELAHWRQVYDSTPALFDQVQSGHFSQAIFIDDPAIPQFQQVVLFHQPGCGGPPCSFVSFVFADESFEFVPDAIEARLLYVPTIDSSNSITWDCFFDGQPNFYGDPIPTPQEVVDKYFPQCTVG